MSQPPYNNTAKYELCKCCGSYEFTVGAYVYSARYILYPAQQIGAVWYCEKCCNLRTAMIAMFSFVDCIGFTYEAT